MTDRKLKDLIAGLAKENQKLARENQKTATAQRKTEAALASFTREAKAAIASIAEERKKTNESQRQIRKELAEERKKTNESQRQIRKELAEERKKTDESQRQIRKDLAEERKKTDESQRQIRKELAEERKKTEASQRQLRKELGGLGHRQGEIAEDLFGRSLIPLMIKRELVLDTIIQGMEKVGGKEYDVVGLNSTKLVLLEVKTKLRQKDVKDFLNKKIPAFRQDFPEYGDRKIIGAMGALVVKKEVVKYAASRGIYVLAQNGKDGAEIVNPAGFRVKSF